MIVLVDRSAGPFDAAVIGAGVVGLACAAELRRAGMDVVVLERNRSPGEGSTGKANGGIRAQFSIAIDIAMSLHSIAVYESMAARFGGSLGLHQTGYLMMTADADTAARLHRARSLQRSLGADTVWLDPGEVAARADIVATEGLRGANFHARDGFIDPAGVVAAYVRILREGGTELLRNAPVTGIGEGPGGMVRLRVEGRGPVLARRVVDAAGPHAAEVAGMFGVEIPIVPVRRNLAFLPSERRRLIPMCVDLDTGVLVRREAGGGYVVAYSDPNDPPGWDTSLDPRFLEAVAQRIGNRFPGLGSLPLDARRCWAGLYPETPDHLALVGPAPGEPRLLLCAGFGGHGLMHAPAAGRAIADLAAGRDPCFDLRPLRPGRFAEGDVTVEPDVL